MRGDFWASGQVLCLELDAGLPNEIYLAVN